MSVPDRISIFAPGGIGEVTPGSDLAALVVDALAADPDGPLRDGDVVVVTSKVVSKAEGRLREAEDRTAAVLAESTHTLARRGPTRIVRTATGLTLAAAGVDSSNVAPGQILLLPVDPDASADRLRADLEQRAGVRVGVIVSDTLGRAWRMGQTDHAIGSSGVTVLDEYAGRRDPYGNDLQVTAVALADELAAAADLVKTKLAGRPVAVVRGLAHLVDPAAAPARRLAREPAMDLFGYGSREAVLAAVLAVTGLGDRYEELVGLEPAARVSAVRDAAGLAPAAADLAAALLLVDHTTLVQNTGTPSPNG